MRIPCRRPLRVSAGQTSGSGRGSGDTPAGRSSPQALPVPEQIGASGILLPGAMRLDMRCRQPHLWRATELGRGQGIGRGQAIRRERPTGARYPHPRCSCPARRRPGGARLGSDRRHGTSDPGGAAGRGLHDRRRGPHHLLQYSRSRTLGLRAGARHSRVLRLLEALLVRRHAHTACRVPNGACARAGKARKGHGSNRRAPGWLARAVHPLPYAAARYVGPAGGRRQHVDGYHRSKADRVPPRICWPRWWNPPTTRS